MSSNGFQQMLKSLCVGALHFFRGGAIVAVIHSQHDRYNSRLMRKQVACQPFVDRASTASGHAVAAHAGSIEMQPHGWKTSSCVQLHPLVIQILLRDAVSIENDRISSL